MENKGSVVVVVVVVLDGIRRYPDELVARSLNKSPGRQRRGNGGTIFSGPIPRPAQLKPGLLRGIRTYLNIYIHTYMHTYTNKLSEVHQLHIPFRLRWEMVIVTLTGVCCAGATETPRQLGEGDKDNERFDTVGLLFFSLIF